VFYRWLVFCADSDVPELHRLARTLDSWRDELLARFTVAGVSNGPTESINLLMMARAVIFAVTQPARCRTQVQHPLNVLPPGPGVLRPALATSNCLSRTDDYSGRWPKFPRESSWWTEGVQAVAHTVRLPFQQAALWNERGLVAELDGGWSYPELEAHQVRLIAEHAWRGAQPERSARRFDHIRQRVASARRRSYLPFLAGRASV
jgi:hypothetical protein